MLHVWDKVNVLVDIYGVDRLSWVRILVRVFKHVYEAALLNGNDNLLERDSPLLNEQAVLLGAPFEADIHTSNIA